VRRDSRGAVVDRMDDERVLYDIVLLAGSPRRLTLRLAPVIVSESLIEVDGEEWMVADVRPAAGDGPAPADLYLRGLKHHLLYAFAGRAAPPVTPAHRRARSVKVRVGGGAITAPHRERLRAPAH